MRHSLKVTIDRIRAGSCICLPVRAARRAAFRLVLHKSVSCVFCRSAPFFFSLARPLCDLPRSVLRPPPVFTPQLHIGSVKVDENYPTTLHVISGRSISETVSAVINIKHLPLRPGNPEDIQAIVAKVRGFLWQPDRTGSVDLKPCS